VFTSDTICRVYKVWTFNFGRAFSKASYQLQVSSLCTFHASLESAGCGLTKERRTWTKTFLLVVPP
jgi:hypothetical protein